MTSSLYIQVTLTNNADPDQMPHFPFKGSPDFNELRYFQERAAVKIVLPGEKGLL